MDSKEDFMDAFERTQAKGDLKLSKEEAEKFKTAFEDPEFCKLMSEYVADLQNPEYRAETEAYIGQLESEDKVPQGKELIRPQKGFVAKSRKKDAKDKEDSKVFINIVQSEKITKPTKTDTAKGQNWSLPYSLGPPHMEKDKKEDAVVAFDCCFHPDALSMGSRYKAFRDLLVSTAIQGIEEACRLQNQTTTVNKDFHILKGVTYKSGEVPTMMIDTGSKETKWSSEAADKQQQDSSQSPPQKPAEVEAPPKEQCAFDMVTAVEQESENHNPPKPKTKSKPALKKGFLNNAKTAGSLYPTGSNEGSRGVSSTKPLVEELPEGYVPKSASSTAVKAATSKVASAKAASSHDKSFMTAREVKRKAPAVTNSHVTQSDDKAPAYTLTERGILGLGDFDGGTTSHKRKPLSNRPEELVYRIEIPLVTKTSKVELDVGEKELKMTYLDVYDLCIQLPYRVYEKKGGAKFDKAKKLLTITLPVQPFQLEDMVDDNDMSDSAEVEMVSEVADLAATSNTQSRGKEPKTPPCSVHNRWLSGEDKSASSVEETTGTDESGAARSGQQQETLAQEIARKAKEAVAEAERVARERGASRDTASSFSDNTAGTLREVNAKQGTAVTSDNSSDSVGNVIDYIPSGTYVGSKNGYVFKKGVSGVGYYIDNGGKIPKHVSAPVTPSAPIDSLDALDITRSTIDCSAAKSHNSSEIDWKEFEYQYRQTKEGVAMIVDVKHIIEESVNIQFHATSFDVSFSAVAGTGDSSVDIKTADYALSFDCMKELDVAACKFDVATHNMVVVLQKKVAEFWVSGSTCEGGQVAPGVVSSRPYSGVCVATTRAVNEATPPGEVGSSGEKAEASVGVDAKRLLSEMQFVSTAGLLDLD